MQVASRMEYEWKLLKIIAEAWTGESFIRSNDRNVRMKAWWHHDQKSGLVLKWAGIHTKVKEIPQSENEFAGISENLFIVVKNPSKILVSKYQCDFKFSGCISAKLRRMFTPRHRGFISNKSRNDDEGTYVRPILE